MKKKKWILIILTILLIAIVIVIIINNTGQEETMEKNLEVTSIAFKEGELIPKKYSGEAEDMSPPLTLGEFDKKAKSIAIIMKDIDAPIGVFTHWVMWNIPVQKDIPENIPKDKVVTELANAKQGKNSMRKIGYMGPKPPSGTHRYVFHVYVLDKELDLKVGANSKKLHSNMEGHILQYGTLTGTLTKSK